MPPNFIRCDATQRYLKPFGNCGMHVHWLTQLSLRHWTVYRVGLILVLIALVLSLCRSVNEFLTPKVDLTVAQFIEEDRDTCRGDERYLGRSLVIGGEFVRDFDSFWLPPG